MKVRPETASTADKMVPTPHVPDARPVALLVEPDGNRRRQAVRGLKALGYECEPAEAVDQVGSAPSQGWALVLTGSGLSEDDVAMLHRRLAALPTPVPPVCSLGAIYDEQGDEHADVPDTQQEGPEESRRLQPWTDEFKLTLLRWAVEQGPAVLRPIPSPDASLGHRYPRLEKQFGVEAEDAVRVLEDLADFGVLTRRVSNRVHLCPNCRRWTVNFRESCPTCAGLDIDIEDLIHHFACAYVGLDSEYRDGAERRCPKCNARLNHVGLDYERPNQTYVCRDCEALFENPVVTAQCLDCRWEGSGSEALAWSIYEYELTDRGHEAVERGELRGLKLREMIRSTHGGLASREFIELETEREMFRLQRYDRPVSMLVCRFLLDGVPYALLREGDPAVVRQFAARVCGTVRTLDVAAAVDATAIAMLLPETDDTQVQQALVRLRGVLDAFELCTPGGRDIERHWTATCWLDRSASAQDVFEWLQQQIEPSRDEG